MSIKIPDCYEQIEKDIDQADEIDDEMGEQFVNRLIDLNVKELTEQVEKMLADRTPEEIEEFNKDCQELTPEEFYRKYFPEHITDDGLAILD